MAGDPQKIVLNVKYFRDPDEWLHDPEMQDQVSMPMEFDRRTRVLDLQNMIANQNNQSREARAKCGIFVPNDDPENAEGLTGIWWDPNKTIEFHMPVDNQEIHYKSRFRRVKIEFQDGQSGSFEIDDAQPAQKLIDMICDKKEITGTSRDEYSISVESTETMETMRTLGTMGSNTMGGSRTLLGTMKTGGKTMKHGTMSPGSNKEHHEKDKPGTLHARDAKKMEKLKKKLKTDDDRVWVDHNKSLREQGINEDENIALVFRRKFFFTDVNVTETDPTQLLYLFKQTSVMILQGKLPVSEEVAIELAALTVISEFGYEPGFGVKSRVPNYKDLVPHEYRKTRGLDKEIDKACERLDTALNNEVARHQIKDEDYKTKKAMKMYVDKCRDLKTYGYQYFLVKKKMKGKNKLVPALMGIDKDGVIVVDHATKEETEKFLLYQIQKYYATEQAFTIDVSGYHGGTYSVQTTEGKQIAGLLGGYIDIHMKMRERREREAMLMQENATLEEENVSANKIQTFRPNAGEAKYPGQGSVSIPGVIRNLGGEGGRGGGQRVTISQMTWASPAQRAKVDQYFERGVKQVAFVQDDLSAGNRKGYTSGKDPSLLGLHASHDIANLSRVAATLVGGGNDENRSEIESKLSTVSNDLASFSEAIKQMSYYLDSPEDQQGLMNAALDLTRSFGGLLHAARPGAETSPAEMQEAVERFVRDQAHIVELMRQFILLDPQNQAELVELTKQVLDKVGALANKAQEISSTATDHNASQNIMRDAGNMYDAGRTLHSVANILAPVAYDPLSQHELRQATERVSHSVKDVVATVKPVTDQQTFEEVLLLSNDVHGDLGNLGAFVKSLADQYGAPGSEDGSGDVGGGHFGRITKLVNKVEAAMAAGDDATAMAEMKKLCLACNALVREAKEDAQKSQHPDENILRAATGLATTIRGMLTLIQSGEPLTSEQVSPLMQKVQAALPQLLRDEYRLRAFKRLEACVWHACGAAHNDIQVGKLASPIIQSHECKARLVNSSEHVSNNLPVLLTALQQHRAHNTKQTQARLINLSRDFLQPGEDLVLASQASLAYIADPLMTQQLGQSSLLLDNCLKNLNDALNNAADLCGYFDVDSAIVVSEEALRELGSYRQLSSQGILTPIEQEQGPDAVHKYAADLNQNCHKINNSLGELINSIANTDTRASNQAARDLAQELQEFCALCRQTAALMPPNEQASLLEAAERLVHETRDTLQSIQHVLEHGDEYMPNVAQKATDFDEALQLLIASLPGQREFQQCGEIIVRCAQMVKNAPNNQQRYTKFANHAELQHNLQSCSGQLNDSVNTLLKVTTENPSALPSHVLNACINLDDFIMLHLDYYLVSVDKNSPEGKKMLSILSRMVASTNSLVSVSKQLCSSETADAGLVPKQAAAAKQIIADINALLDLAVQASPGLKQCDSALRNIEIVSRLLANPTQPINDESYYENYEDIMSASSTLGDNMSKMTFDAKSSDMPAFGNDVDETCGAICKLIEAAAQIAYLIGVSDKESQPGSKAVMDVMQFEANMNDLLDALRAMNRPDVTTEQMIPLSAEVAKATRTVCQQCMAAGQASNNPALDSQFRKAAAQIATCTKKVIDNVRKGEQLTPEAFALREDAIKTLEEVMADVIKLASARELAGVQAQISDQGRKMQQPIIQSGELVRDASLMLVGSAKNLCGGGQQPGHWNAVAESAEEVTKSVQMLLTEIREQAPWQKQCDSTLDHLARVVNSFNQEVLEMQQNRTKFAFASIESIAQTLLGLIEKLLLLSRDLRGVIDQNQVERIGQIAMKIVNENIVHLLHTSKAFADCISSQEQQLEFLHAVTTVYENCNFAITAAKTYSVAPQAQNRDEFDNDAENFEQSLRELRDIIENLASRFGNIGLLLNELDQTLMSPQSVTLSEAELAKTLKQLADNMREYTHTYIKTSSDMTPASDTQVDRLGPLCKDLTDNLIAILQHANAIRNLRGEKDEVANELYKKVHQLLELTRARVELSDQILKSPYDRKAKQAFHANSQQCRGVANEVLEQIERLFDGANSCDAAIKTITAIISDPSFAILFTIGGAEATASEDSSGGVGEHTATIRKAIDALNNDTYALIEDAADRQDQLTYAAPATANALNVLKSCVVDGVKSLGDGEDQNQTKNLLLGAVREVAVSLTDVLESTRNFCYDGHDVNRYVKVPSEKFIQNLSHLKAYVTDIEGMHDLVSNSLNSGINVLNENIKILDNKQNLVKTDPATLTDKTETIHIITTGIVASYRTRNLNQLMDYSSKGVDNVTSMLNISRNLAYSLPSGSSEQNDMFNAARGCSNSFSSLLAFLKCEVEGGFAGGQQSQNQMTEITRDVSKNVNKLQTIAEGLQLHEQEEHNAANASDKLTSTAMMLSKGAAKLEEFRPSKAVVASDEAELNAQINFTEDVWNSSTDIARAVLTLIRAATEAQIEIDAMYAKGKHAPGCGGHRIRSGQYQDCFCDAIDENNPLNPGRSRTVGSSENGWGEDPTTPGRRRTAGMYHADAQWSEGLVSAAKEVEIATHHLVRGANDVMQGHGSEEMLISASKQVAAKTAALVYACRSKTTLGATVESNLTRASDNVKRATAALVGYASEYVASKPQEVITLPVGKVATARQEIKLKEAIEKRQRELTAAREAFEKYQRARYDKGVE